MFFLVSVLWLFAAVSVKCVQCKATFSDCGGANSKIIMEDGHISPDPLLYPGDVSVTAAIKVLKDLPTSGFKMILNLQKLEPIVMPVPCLKNIGSCSYDVCDMIQKHPETFCPMFPKGEKCACPMKAGDYSLQNAIVALPDFGPIFAKILQGNYNGSITFTDTAAGLQVGCIAITFEVKPST